MNKKITIGRKWNAVKAYFPFCLIWAELDGNSVAIHNSVCDSGQFPYNRSKASRKFWNRLHSKIILCKLTTCKYMSIFC